MNKGIQLSGNLYFRCGNYVPNLFKSVSTFSSKRVQEATTGSDSETEQQRLEKLFDVLKDRTTQNIPVGRLFSAIESTGIVLGDPRLTGILSRISAKIESPNKAFAGNLAENPDFQSVRLDRDSFAECLGPDWQIIDKIMRNDMVIPDWRRFKQNIKDIYYKCAQNTGGKNSTMIPQLARADPSHWSVGVCTTDGQRFWLGDTAERFCLHAAHYPISYAVALNDNSSEEIHNYVGQEPSGLPYAALSLNHDNKPHNPMINSGAIVVSSLLQRGHSLADKFDYILSKYRALAGGEYTAFDNGTFLSEREVSHGNFSMGYILKEMKCFPEPFVFQEVMDFYFQLCSVQITSLSGSVIAATMANGGICPVSGNRLLTPEAVRNTLSLMHSCGMYDYSGQFAFTVGLPAKSGVSGMILLVVPNMMGICLYSPPLDEHGNSVKGVQFCQELVQSFPLHQYDSLLQYFDQNDPRNTSYSRRARLIYLMLFSASNNDITALRRGYLRGVDMNEADYDGRTALHIGAAEGHMEVVKFLLEEAKVNPTPKDRWTFTPLMEAKRFNQPLVAQYLENFIDTYAEPS